MSTVSTSITRRGRAGTPRGKAPPSWRPVARRALPGHAPWEPAAQPAAERELGGARGQVQTTIRAAGPGGTRAGGCADALGAHDPHRRRVAHVDLLQLGHLVHEPRRHGRLRRPRGADCAITRRRPPRSSSWWPQPSSSKPRAEQLEAAGGDRVELASRSHEDATVGRLHRDRARRRPAPGQRSCRSRRRRPAASAERVAARRGPPAAVGP